MRTSSIRHRANARLAILFEDFLEICEGNMLAAMLLAILVYWTDIKINKKDTNLWVWKSHQDFQEDLMFDKPGMKPPHRTTIKCALDLLESKDYIEKRKNPKMPLDQTKQYLVHLEVVQSAIDALPPIVVKPTLQRRNSDIATSNNQQSLSENQQCNVEIPTSNTNDYSTEITTPEIIESIVVSAVAENDAPSLFAFQVQNFPLHFYHDFCIHAQDRGINDGLVLIVKNLRDVPADAECQICYKLVHGPHGYYEIGNDAPAPIDFTEQKKKRDTEPRIPAVSSHSQETIGNFEGGDEEDFEGETQKMPAIPKQTPAAGTRVLATDPPVGIQDDSTSAQASRDGTYSTPAQRSGSSLSGIPASPGAVQARQVTPKRPLRKVIEKPQLTFGGQQVREWYEQARDCKVRMTDKNVITLNRLADIDEMTQENLRDVLELYDTDKWLIEHNVTVDLQELEKQDGKFTFERGLLAVKRKRRANAPARNGKVDAYGNDYSLTGLLVRNQKAM